jgi:hypothetical protein
MKAKTPGLKYSIFVSILTVVGSGSASAASYSFHQIGYTGGGIITGLFEAEDLNNDSVIDSEEVTSFSLSFTGDSTVADFSYAFNDLFVLRYKMGSGFLGDDFMEQPNGSEYEGLVVGMFSNSNYVLLSGAGPTGGQYGGFIIDNATGSEVSETPNLIAVSEVSAVPVPSALWLFGSGMLSLIGLTRRKSS